MKKIRRGVLFFSRESILRLTTGGCGEIGNTFSCYNLPTDLCTVQNCATSIGPPCATMASNCNTCPM